MSTNGAIGLRNLLQDQVGGMYYVEKQLVTALTTWSKIADHGELKAAITGHLEETKLHMERLERVFKTLGIQPNARKCPAIDGILQEGEEIMNEFKGDPARDAALVAAGQKVEHYEIASYGIMCEWAKELGLTAVQDLLHETLEEEKAANEKLNSIAEQVVDLESGTTASFS